MIIRPPSMVIQAYRGRAVAQRPHRYARAHTGPLPTIAVLTRSISTVRRASAASSTSPTQRMTLLSTYHITALTIV